MNTETLTALGAEVSKEQKERDSAQPAEFLKLPFRDEL